MRPSATISYDSRLHSGCSAVLNSIVKDACPHQADRLLHADGCCTHTGGLDKLADIISPSADLVSKQEAAVSALQKTLRGAQAILESKQAAAFGEEVRSTITA